MKAVLTDSSLTFLSTDHCYYTNQGSSDISILSSFDVDFSVIQVHTPTLSLHLIALQAIQKSLDLDWQTALHGRRLEQCQRSQTHCRLSILQHQAVVARLLPLSFNACQGRLLPAFTGIISGNASLSLRTL